MNFFESQDVARRKTGRLIVLFVLAVIAITVLTYLVVAGALVFSGAVGDPGSSRSLSRVVHPALLLGVGSATILIIGLASLTKLAQLRGGGSVVAESLGGRPVVPGHADRVERRVLNVVEEMAIASGVGVPPVYILDEQGINAFAAGFDPSNAVIGVSRGCAERLTRDELQGVVAHEFSHILNGDMRLNIRLIGVLHGILVIGLLGHILLRSSFYAGMATRRSSRDRGGGAGLILAIGAGLAIVGFAGTFFGNWIKAAVSRQREFLADASAVQFTRNPTGISGALKKIGGFEKGARLDTPNASVASHMFFGRAVTRGLSSMFSTHPPLPERIRRIEPGWDEKFIASKPAPRRGAAGATAGVAAIAQATTRTRRPSKAATRPAGSQIDLIGRPSPEHVAYAQELIARMPPDLSAAAHEPFGAQAVILGLLVQSEADVRNRQMALVDGHGNHGIGDELRRLLPSIETLDPKLRLPLMETALGALAAMSPPQYETFRRMVVELCRADGQLDLFEWCVQRIVLDDLDVRFGRARRPRVAYYALTRLGSACGQVLSVLAYAGHGDPDAAGHAFDHGATALPGLHVRFFPREQCGLRQLDEALAELARVAPREKRPIIVACATCIAADHAITVNEAELLRAIASILECPMPPLLPGQPVV